VLEGRGACRYELGRLSPQNERSVDHHKKLLKQSCKSFNRCYSALSRGSNARDELATGRRT